jgi:hypothetical protein
MQHLSIECCDVFFFRAAQQKTPSAESSANGVDCDSNVALAALGSA